MYRYSSTRFKMLIKIKKTKYIIECVSKPEISIKFKSSLLAVFNLNRKLRIRKMTTKNVGIKLLKKCEKSTQEN